MYVLLANSLVFGIGDTPLDALRDAIKEGWEDEALENTPLEQLAEDLFENRDKLCFGGSSIFQCTDRCAKFVLEDGGDPHPGVFTIEGICSRHPIVDYEDYEDE